MPWTKRHAAADDAPLDTASSLLRCARRMGRFGGWGGLDDRSLDPLNGGISESIAWEVCHAVLVGQLGCGGGGGRGARRGARAGTNLRG